MIIEKGKPKERSSTAANKKQHKIANILRKAEDFQMKGELKKAISEIERAIELNPTDGNLYNRLGDMCIKAKEIKKAVGVYKRGIKIFESDDYCRNAVALCKKVLRHDPENIEIYLELGKLLVELGDKSDALNYLFRYIEKQKEKDNKKEILGVLKYIQDLGISDRKAQDKIAEIYASIGRKDFAKNLYKKIKPEAKSQGPKPAEVSKRPSESEGLIEEVDSALRKAIGELKEKETKVDIGDTVEHVDKALSELRKAIRLDKVISTLEDSLKGFSKQQKESIALLQKSLNLNLDTLQDTIEKLQKNTIRDMSTLGKLLKGLAEALSLLSKSQRAIPEKIGGELVKLSDNFKKATNKAVDDIKGLSASYQRASDDMCEKLEETKNSSLSLLNISEELKSGIEKINITLSEFVLSQEQKGKKQGLYFIVMLALIAAICGLLAFSSFK